jgi:hypothetical protein
MISDVAFDDSITVGDTCNVAITVQNTGSGTAENVYVELTNLEHVQILSQDSIYLGSIASGVTRMFSFEMIPDEFEISPEDSTGLAGYLIKLNSSNSQTRSRNIYFSVYCQPVLYGSVSGVVIDSLTRQLLVDVNAVVTQESLVKGSDTTRIDGQYYISGLLPGFYAIEFSKEGYQNKVIIGLTILAGQSTAVDAELVEAPLPCIYLQGDINGDGLRGGGDVTYGVRFFKLIGNRPPDSCYMDSTHAYLYVAGDVNGNCEFRGSDITRLVAYFKLIALLQYCHFFPPPPMRERGSIIKPKD